MSYGRPPNQDFGKAVAAALLITGLGLVRVVAAARAEGAAAERERLLALGTIYRTCPECEGLDVVCRTCAPLVRVPADEIEVVQ